MHFSQFHPVSSTIDPCRSPTQEAVMSETTPPQPERKKRGWCFCAGCLLLPILAVGCLAAAYFLGPRLADALNLFGPEAEEVYAYAPNELAGRELEAIFTAREIPGVRVTVIPIKGENTHGAFITLDASAGYRGLSPLDDEDEVFREVMTEITRRDRALDLNLAHVTVEYRDEMGDSAAAFTAPQSLVEEYAAGTISHEEFFSGVEIDLLRSIDYLDLDIGEILEEVQP
jgi:hypothetical protein